METWRKVWREGVAPLLSAAALTALADGLERDDERIIQGRTVLAEWPAVSQRESPAAAACALGYCGWLGEELETVGEIEDFFGRLCGHIDDRLELEAGCRWFLNWFDETPREEMRRELRAEVRLELEQRGQVARAA